MRAIRQHEFGGPEVLTYEEVPRPEPGPGEVLDGQRVAVVEGARDLRAFLREQVVSTGRTAIVCSNDPTEARALADRVLFLEGGKLHADAPPERIEAELGLS